jgi:glycosyltransferase involved in cell wall biosynthesis
MHRGGAFSASGNQKLATRWHLITGEYPPAPGGVADYSRTVARRLAECGDEVQVWAPEGFSGEVADAGIEVHRLPDRFGPSSLMRLNRGVDASALSRILVQYVPHAFGWKAMNIPFCLWLWTRRLNSIDVMFHEVAFPIARSQPLTHNALGFVNRVMAAIVARSAERIFVSTTSWEPQLRSMLSRDRPIRCVPIPSSVEVVCDAARAGAIRRALAPANTKLVGHFGTFGSSITDTLAAAIAEIARQRRDAVFVLIGRGSDGFRERLAKGDTALGNKIHATGELGVTELSSHISACDLMLQPYPDGISTRRTTAMAALSHGVALVTTTGHLTEHLWSDAAAVVMAPARDSVALAGEAIHLLDDERERNRLAAAGRALYATKFDVALTITALRNVAALDAAAVHARQYSDERSA